MDSNNYRLCRICISRFETSVMMSIFGENALWKKITSFANVHIEEGDTLPQHICVVCANNVINAYCFKIKCEEADSFYRKQMLRKMELRLPEDTEIISIASGMRNNINNTVNQQKQLISNNDEENVRMNSTTDIDEDNSFVDNFPTLIDESAGLSSEEQTEWDGGIEQHSSCSEDKFDDSLPLIPEIELITPNDEDIQNEIGNNDRQYECDVCSKFFTMKSLLRHHLKTFHPENNPSYQCFECKKSYLSKRFLEKHIRLGRCIKKRKNTTRPMQCSECKKVFPSGHHLGWHKRTGSCRSRSPKLSLTAYERNDSEENDGLGNMMNSRKDKRKKFGKLKQRGGRTRIRLDSKKIALATELVKQEVSTTKFAQELNISRTFAWRLRKTIENNLYKEGKLNDIKSKSKVAMEASVTAPNITKITDLNKKASKDFTNLLKNQIEINDMNHEDFKNKIEENKNSTQRSNDMKNLCNTQGFNAVIETNKSIIENNSISENFIGNKFPICQKDSIKFKQELKEEKQEYHKTENLSTNESESESQCSKNSQNESIQPGCSASFNEIDSVLNLSNKRNKSIKSLDNSTKRSKKPRKPNVFIDDVKYAQAKLLIANNASTMEIAKKLDVSQMSAWKLRDCILKNIPLKLKKTTFEDYNSHIKKSIIKKTKIKPKTKVPRQRLRRDERLKRDKIIKKEILNMIKIDRNIQYWKVSERLAEKGFSVSSSSVCQRLKSMGIHRRLRQNEQKYDSNVTNNDDNIDTDCDYELQNLTIETTVINLEDHSHFLKTHFNNLA